MNTTQKRLKHYDTVSEEIKYISKSLIRIKILFALYQSPSDMKELTLKTNMHYSSVSTVLRNLEIKGMIYRKSKRYYLVNSIRLQVKNFLELAIIINLLEEIFNIIQGHVIEKLPLESVKEFHYLEKAKLLESDGINTDEILNFIEKTLDNANSARCILPIYYEGINEKLNQLEHENKFVEIIVAKTIHGVYEDNSKVKYISTFTGRNNFMLIITNDVMILGFFKNENLFDTNRILVSTSRDSLKWANNLFRYFKKST